MGRSLRKEIEEAPTGEILEELLRLQVDLITSLPREAARRVQEIATGTLFSGARSDELRREILRTGDVTESRARLIARTETSRAAASLMQARAQHVGSDGYIWRTVKDFRVRHSHEHMEGQFVKWDDPPTLDNLTGHAGCLPNCRCWAEPVLPDIEDLR